MKYFNLNNGLKIPSIGLGSAGIWGGKKEFFKRKIYKQFNIYSYAVKQESCLVDTSAAYGYSEKVLGLALKLRKKREKVFICSKVSNKDQKSGNIKSTLEKSLNNLGTDYLDLYLLHWPQTDTYIESYLEMEKLYLAGKIKAIGVCNFHRHHFIELMKSASVIPTVNQIEIHPLFTQSKLISYCKSNGTQVMAYSPLGRMHDVLLNSRILRKCSKKYNKTIPQIILRWDFQCGLISIPRTFSKKHYDEFMDIFLFELTADEVSQISELNDNVRLRYNPDKCDFSRL